MIFPMAHTSTPSPLPAGDGTHTRLHATALALEGRAALLVGPSGAGKSDLALRCLMRPARIGSRLLAADLVADDQVLIDACGEALVCRAPEPLAGLIEVRGLGVLRWPAIAQAHVALLVHLEAGGIERMPPAGRSSDILGRRVATISLAPFEASAPMKLLLALSGCAPLA